MVICSIDALMSRPLAAVAFFMLTSQYNERARYALDESQTQRTESIKPNVILLNQPLAFVVTERIEEIPYLEYSSYNLDFEFNADRYDIMGEMWGIFDPTKPRKGMTAVNVGLGIAHNLEVTFKPNFVEGIYEILNNNIVQDISCFISVNGTPLIITGPPVLSEAYSFINQDNKQVHQYLLPYASNNQEYEIQMGTDIYDAIINLYAIGIMQKHKGMEPADVFPADPPELIAELVYYDGAGKKYTDEKRFVIKTYPHIYGKEHITITCELMEVSESSSMPEASQ